MKLYFVRHGQTNANADAAKRDITERNQYLNEKGVEQARNLAQDLEGIAFDAIVTSPLKRALRTAEIINEYHNMPIRVIEDLRERDTKSYLNALEWWDCFDLDKEGQYSGVEKLRDFFARVYSVIEDLKTDYDDKTILLVSHGGVKHAIAAYASQAVLKGNMLTDQMQQCEVRIIDL